MAFRGCPLCGATVRDDLIVKHKRWHSELDDLLATPVAAELELAPWPDEAEPAVPEIIDGR
jgi:hypothetical protein